MLYKPAAVPADQRVIAKMPALGGHFEVYVSTHGCEHVGTFEYTGTAAGSYTAQGGVDFSATPTDLQVTVENYLSAAGVVVVNVVGTAADDSPLTGTATFTPPAYAENQTPDFQVGATVDVVTSGGAKFKTVTNMTVNAHGNAGSRLQLWRLPVESSYSFVGCLEGFNPQIPSPEAVPVACGMRGSRFVLAGRTPPASLEITAKHFNLADGLSRIMGRNATIMAIRKANQVVTTERYVAGNCVLNVGPQIGSGNDEVMDKASGFMGVFFNFWAN